MRVGIRAFEVAVCRSDENNLLGSVQQMRVQQVGVGCALRSRAETIPHLTNVTLKEI